MSTKTTGRRMHRRRPASIVGCLCVLPHHGVTANSTTYLSSKAVSRLFRICLICSPVSLCLSKFLLRDNSLMCPRNHNPLRFLNGEGLRMSDLFPHTLSINRVSQISFIAENLSYRRACPNIFLANSVPSHTGTACFPFILHRRWNGFPI